MSIPPFKAFQRINRLQRHVLTGIRVLGRLLRNEEIDAEGRRKLERYLKESERLERDFMRFDGRTLFLARPKVRVASDEERLEGGPESEGER